MNLSSEQSAPLNNLDFLRTVAVSSVVIEHVAGLLGFYRYAPALSNIGNLGVMLFFVHTAFVLMQSLERQGKPFFIPFMVRRAFRIYPLSMLAVIVVVAFRLPLHDFLPGHFERGPLDFANIISNLLLVQGLTTHDSIISPMWTLTLEMQMYALLPAIFILIRRSNVMGTLVTWALSIALAFCCWRLGLRFAPAPLYIALVQYGPLIFFAPCFVAGVLSFKLHKTYTARLHSFYWPPVLLTLLCAFTFAPKALFHVPVWWILPALVGFLIPMFQQIQNKWIAGPSKVIAKYSYGIYLNHFLCMWLAFEKFGGLPLAFQAVTFLILLAAISFVLYHLVEEPFIRWGRMVAAGYMERNAPVTQSIKVVMGINH